MSGSLPISENQNPKFITKQAMHIDHTKNETIIQIGNVPQCDVQSNEGNIKYTRCDET